MSSINIHKSYVIWPHSRSSDSFIANTTWLEKLKREGIACTHCENVRPGKIALVTTVVADDIEKPDVHLSGLSGLGVGEVFSNSVIAAIGRENLEAIGRLIPLRDQSWNVATNHQVFIARKIPGCIRGEAVDPGICKECGHSLYWPGWPPKKWYILRRDWTPENGLAMLENWFLCTPALYDKCLRALGKGIIGEQIEIRDEPSDGWPSEYSDFIESLAQNGKRK